MLLGLGHGMSELVMGGREPPESAVAAVAAMKESRISMPGRGVSLFMLLRGFSLMMGLLLMGYGTLNLLLPPELALSLPVLGVNLVVAHPELGAGDSLLLCRSHYRNADRHDRLRHGTPALALSRS